MSWPTPGEFAKVIQNIKEVREAREIERNYEERLQFLKEVAALAYGWQDFDVVWDVVRAEHGLDIGDKIFVMKYYIMIVEGKLR